MLDTGNQHLIMIGTQKSGTTWLQHVLDLDARFWLPPKQEVHYFDKCASPSFQEYNQIFKDAPEHAITVDVTPIYIRSQMARESILDGIESGQLSAKIVAIFREPADRSFSHYQMNSNRGKRHGDFISALKAGSLIYHNSCYGSQIEPWLQTMQQDKSRFYLFDDIVSNPEFVLEDLSSFLGLHELIKSPYEGQPVNVGGIDRSRLWPAVRRVSGRSLRAIGARKLLHRIKNSGAVQFLEKKNKKRIKLSAEEYQMAKELFVSEVHKLDELLPELDVKRRWNY